MDHRMPGIGGLEAASRISVSYPNTKIIDLSVYTEEPFLSRFLKAGASGYLTQGGQLH